MVVTIACCNVGILYPVYREEIWGTGEYAAFSVGFSSLSSSLKSIWEYEGCFLQVAKIGGASFTLVPYLQTKVKEMLWVDGYCCSTRIWIDFSEALEGFAAFL